MNQKYFWNDRLTILRSLSLALLLIAGSFLGANAQEQKTLGESSLTPKFGIKGGLNLTNLYVDDVKDENVKAGFNAGIFAKLPVIKGLSIQPELLYTSKGSKITYDNAFGNGEFRFNLNYVELPLLAVINLAKNFNIHAGGYAAYLVNANITQLKDNGNTNELVSFNEDDFKRFDYGLVGGLGFDVQNFTIGARYNYGLSEVGDKNSVASQALRNSKNSAISLYLGLAF
ncbi:MAG: porin family protein [Flavitalea sp.]